MTTIVKLSVSQSRELINNGSDLSLSFTSVSSAENLLSVFFRCFIGLFKQLIGQPKTLLKAAQFLIFFLKEGETIACSDEQWYEHQGRIGPSDRPRPQKKGHIHGSSLKKCLLSRISLPLTLVLNLEPKLSALCVCHKSLCVIAYQLTRAV